MTFSGDRPRLGDPFAEKPHTFTLNEEAYFLIDGDVYRGYAVGTYKKEGELYLTDRLHVPAQAAELGRAKIASRSGRSGGDSSTVRTVSLEEAQRMHKTREELIQLMRVYNESISDAKSSFAFEGASPYDADRAMHALSSDTPLSARAYIAVATLILARVRERMDENGLDWKRGRTGCDGVLDNVLFVEETLRHAEPIDVQRYTRLRLRLLDYLGYMLKLNQLAKEE